MPPGARADRVIYSDRASCALEPGQEPAFAEPWEHFSCPFLQAVAAKPERRWAAPAADPPGAIARPGAERRPACATARIT